MIRLVVSYSLAIMSGLIFEIAYKKGIIFHNFSAESLTIIGLLLAVLACLVYMENKK